MTGSNIYIPIIEYLIPMTEKENNGTGNLAYRCIHLTSAQRKQSQGHTLSPGESYCVSGACGGYCEGRVNTEEVVERRKQPHIYHL